ncbi:MAG: hypothetical protein AMJ81_08460 [Phycisphaerae bacterium SM23_33]|nr:MAG: hypothetical protein AMJ81_08460 [Phycisphaerae bacterium SM23_33]
MGRLAWVTLAAALAAAGCETSMFSQGVWTPKSPARGGIAAATASDSQEDSYSILLWVLNDPARHVEDAERCEKALSEKLGWKGLFVVHKAGHSELFWGRYASPADADKNLKTAKAHRTQDGVPVFAKAMVVPLPGKDIGPKEWRLEGVDARYSLLVAVFKDAPERKYTGRRQRAVDYCRRLREHGYEGYYYHGKVVSHVTIGAFGREAVRERKSREGTQLEILDPRIEQLRKDFPELQVNGNTVTDVFRDPRTDKVVKKVTRQSQLIRVPRSQSADVG